MPLAAGTRLGPYEVVAALGAGGMGEVYRASDSRLARDVAIKVLPQHLSANAEVRTRFEREAKTVSSLNHPNICTLFDVGREGDIDYLVMELVDGETLAQRLARGALPSADVLKLAAQIADALSRAHRAGVIHRDLKPGNVMLTKSGAKLMDFGLARVTGLAGAGGTSGLAATLSQSPTMAAPLTAEGTIVGTFQYMAPEQLEGKEADARSDLWALGCVLYEMATGHRAFDGRSQASLISSIMSSEPPPIAKLAPLAPAGLDRLVRTCLAKDPDERAQTAHDVKLQLQAIAEDGSGAGLPASATGAATPSKRRERLAWSLMAVSLLAAVGVGLAPRWFARLPAAAPAGHWNLVLPDAAPLDFFAPSLYGEGQPALAISRDGGRLAYVARQNGAARLLFRRVDEADWHPLAGTEGASQPFFSPDGEWIGFFADDEMKKVAVAGGMPLTIARVLAPRGAAWAKDGRIFFCSRVVNPIGLCSVPASGGNPTLIAGGLSDLYWPSLLPGEHWILGSSGGRRLLLFSLDEKRVLTLGDSGPVPAESTDTANLLTGTYPRYVRSGHLVYLVGNTLMALPFDPERRRVLGPPAPVVQDVRRESWNGGGQYDLGDDGTLVFAPGADAARSVLVWADRTGRVTDTLSVPAGDHFNIFASNDGHRVALATNLPTGQQTLSILDVQRGLLREIPTSGVARFTAWWPDGERAVVYLGSQSAAAVARPGQARGAWRVPVEGTGTRDSLLEQGCLIRDVSRDERYFAVTRFGDSSGVWLVTGEGRQKTLLKPDAWWPVFSPDGRWLAFGSDDGLQISAVPPDGRLQTVGPVSADEPEWSPRGDELYYRDGMRWMVMTVSTHNGLTVGKPRLLFEGRFLNVWAKSYDVGPDGRFLLLAGPPEETVNHLDVVTGFLAELRKLAPPATK